MPHLALVKRAIASGISDKGGYITTTNLSPAATPLILQNSKILKNETTGSDPIVSFWEADFSLSRRLTSEQPPLALVKRAIASGTSVKGGVHNNH